MKRIALFSVLFAMFLAMGLTSCNKDTEATASVTVVMDDEAQSLLKTMKTVTVDSGYVNIIAAELQAKEDGEQKQYTARVRSRVNLNSGAYDNPIEMELMKGSYTDFKLALTLDAVNDNPAIIVYGTYYDSEGTAVPFEFVYNDSITIYTALDSTYLVDENDAPIFIAYVAPAKWFKEVSTDMLDNATLYDGVIYVSDTSNVDIYNAVVPLIGKSCALQAQNRYRWEQMNGMTDETDNDGDN